MNMGNFLPAAGEWAYGREEEQNLSNGPWMGPGGWLGIEACPTHMEVPI